MPNRRKKNKTLINAVADCEIARAREALQAGAHANALRDDDMTPLHIATNSEYPPELITLLLNYGANPVREDAYGRTPFAFALEVGYDTETILSFIKNIRKNWPYEGQTALNEELDNLVTDDTYNENQRYTIVKNLLQAGADPNTCGMSRVPVLNWAIDAAPVNVMHSLLAYGDNPCITYREPEKWRHLPPVHYAAVTRNETAMRTFLIHGVYLPSRCHRNTSPHL